MIDVPYFFFLIGGVDKDGKTVDNIGDLPPQAQELFARRGELDDLKKRKRVSKHWQSSQLIDNKRTLTRPSGPAPAPPSVSQAPSSGSSTSRTPAPVPPLLVSESPPPQSFVCPIYGTGIDSLICANKYDSREKVENHLILFHRLPIEFHKLLGLRIKEGMIEKTDICIKTKENR